VLVFPWLLASRRKCFWMWGMLYLILDAVSNAVV
jgi:hypothetical protein